MRIWKALGVSGLWIVAGGWGQGALVRPSTHPASADAPRAHLAWRLDDVRPGAFYRPVTAVVSGEPLVFLVERSTGSVVAVDIATGRRRWTASPPAQAAAGAAGGVRGPPTTVTQPPPGYKFRVAPDGPLRWVAR